MITIGEFSKICRLSAKTLRYYDSIGLLKPESVGKYSGYRYYEISQLRDIMLILRLKRYGFSLAEISAVLAKKDSKFLEKCICEKRAQLLLRIGGQKQILLQMERDIDKIERREDIMESNYLIKTTEFKPITIFSYRRKMGLKDIDRAYAEMLAEMAKKMIKPSGPYMIFYHDEEFDPECSDMEIGVQVGDENSGEHIRELAPGFCCYAAHVGPYDNLGECYTALSEWIEKNGYNITGAPFDLYVKDCFGNIPPNEYVTEVYFPITK